MKVEEAARGRAVRRVCSDTMKAKRYRVKPAEKSVPIKKHVLSSACNGTEDFEFHHSFSGYKYMQKSIR